MSAANSRIRLSDPTIASTRAHRLLSRSCASSSVPEVASANASSSVLWASVKLAEATLPALTKTAKTLIQGGALDVEERLIVDGLQSDEARSVSASMPTVEALTPALTLEDLGVKRWQPPEDIAAQLTTPLTPAGRRRRRVLRAIEANPGASDRKIAAIAGVDHKTVAAARRSSRWGNPRDRRGSRRRRRTRVGGRNDPHPKAPSTADGIEPGHPGQKVR